MNKLPKARNENILMQNLEKEVLIYDTLTDKAYCLNETSAKVFNHCDGLTSFDDLKYKYKFTDDLIFLALDELKHSNLLADDSSYQTPFAGINRREVIRRVGFASLIALPVISSLIVPTAAQAASGCVTTNCNFSTPIAQRNCCSSTTRCIANRTCVACYTSGQVYSAATSNSGCQSDAARGVCCNTTSPAIYDGDTNPGSNACRCP